MAGSTVSWNPRQESLPRSPNLPLRRLLPVTLDKQASEGWVQPHSPLSHKSSVHLLNLTAPRHSAPDLGQTTTTWEQSSHLSPSSKKGQSSRLLDTSQ